MSKHDSYRLRFDLEQHFNAKVYTSGSTVRGSVFLHALRDIHFDKLEICLIGVSTTQNFLQHESGIVVAPFMKLLMPLRSNHLPVNQVFLADKKYSLPFSFIVPFQLTIGACRHQCITPSVHEQHLRPPPTMGFWDLDDQSPQITQIKYAVSIVALKKDLSQYLPLRILEGCHMIRVLPALPEDAPLDINPLDDSYIMSKSKTIRKNFVISKLGSLSATASQPKALILSPDGRASTGTSCRLKHVFNTTSGRRAAPHINLASGKLASHTFFDMSSMSCLPNMGSRRTCDVMAPYQYSTSIKLFSPPVVDLDWKEENSVWKDPMRFSQDLPGPVMNDDWRRASAATCPDTAGSSKRYVTELDIRFSLSDHKKVMYLPTFHSCRISRTYTLELTLSIKQTLSTLSLAIPLQIGVEASDGLPSY